MLLNKIDKWFVCLINILYVLWIFWGLLMMLFCKFLEYDWILVKGVFKLCVRFCMILVFFCCLFFIIFIWLLILYVILLKELFNFLIFLGDWNVLLLMNFLWFINCLVLILNCLIFWIKGLIKIL